MDKEKNKELENLEQLRARKWQRRYSRLLDYTLSRKSISVREAEDLFGNKLYEFIGEYFDSRYKGCKEMELPTEHGVLKIVAHALPRLIPKQRYDIVFAPGYIPDYYKEAKELCKSAKYKLNGKIISKEKAENLFGERNVAEAARSAAWHFFISCNMIINYDTCYGELSFRFLKKIRHELWKKRKSEFQVTKSNGCPKRQ